METGKTITLRGFATISFFADDILKVKEWDMQFLGIAPITQREQGFVTTSVVDPLGNILVIMYNHYYLQIFISLKILEQ